MASFLTTTAISFELEKLFMESERFLFILSPYLKLVQRIQVLLAERIISNIDVRIVYGKDELSKDEKLSLSKFSNLGLYYCHNLHAKCFITEKSAIISSMNLYEYSQVNNYEMGIVLSAKTDMNLYNPILNETVRIVNASALKNSDYKEPLPIGDYRLTYTMSDVYSFITSNFKSSNNYSGNRLYSNISTYALTIANFSKQDMYQDGSSLLRQTKITQEIFNKIVAHFTDLYKSNNSSK